MDDFVMHCEPLPRLHPSPLRILSIGYVAGKTNSIDAEFSTFNFSFVLRGNGAYRMDGRDWPIAAPCVITQWPGIPVAYGPRQTWEELYIIYPASALAALQACGFAVRERPVWAIHDPGPVRRRIEALREALGSAGRAGGADRVDRTCETLILESLIASESPSADPRETAIRAIRALVEAAPQEARDFDELALEHGLSPAAFRRHWRRLIGPPPARFAMELRLRTACRRLVESRESIGRIAGEVGFSDPLHFSRRFRQHLGLTATEYREKHRLPLSRPEEG